MTRGGTLTITLLRRHAGARRVRLARVLFLCLSIAGPHLPAIAADDDALSTALLERDLEASRYPVRVRAARLLGYLGDARHTQLLARHAVADRARDARVAAAVACGQVAAEADGALLSALLQEALLEPFGSAPAERQARVFGLLRASARAKSGAPLDAVVRALSDADPTVREAACQALAAIGGPRAPAALRGGLREGSEDAPAVVAALAWLDDAAAIPALAKALRAGTDPGAVATAAWGMAGYPEPAAADALRAGLRHALPSIRALCAILLARREDVTAVDALQAATDPAREPSGQVRGAARCALAALQVEGAQDAALRGLTSDDPQERLGSACALRWLPDVPTAALALAAQDTEPQVAAEAIRALSERADGAARQALVRLAATPGPAQAEALCALACQGGEEALPALLQGLTTPEADDAPAVWRAAQAALARIGPSAVPGLADLAGRGSPVAERAMQTLASLGGLEAVRALVAVRDGTDHRLRSACIRALGALPDRAAHDAMVLALADPAADVAEAAATGLLARPDGVPELLKLAQASGSQAQSDAVNRALAGIVRAGGLAATCGQQEGRAALRAWLQTGGGAAARLEPWALCAGWLLGDDAAPANGAALLSGAGNRQARDDLCAMLAANHLTVAAPVLRDWLRETLSRTSGATGTGRARDLVAAVDALGKLGDAESWNLLCAALAEDGTVVAASLEALARISPERALPLLCRGLGDGDADVRCAAFRVLCGAGPEGSSCAARVAPQFATSEWSALAAACPTAVRGRLLGAPDPDVRLTAAASCCRHGLLPAQRLRAELLWGSCGLLPRASFRAQASALDALAPSEPLATRRAACLRALER